MNLKLRINVIGNIIVINVIGNIIVIYVIGSHFSNLFDKNTFLINFFKKSILRISYLSFGDN